MFLRVFCKKLILLIASIILYCNLMSANDHIQMKLKDGNVLIKLRPDLAPNHVKRISELVKSGFYNGLYLSQSHRWFYGTGWRSFRHRNRWLWAKY